MQPAIADRMNQISFSGIREIYERVNQLEQQGASVIHLEVGRPDFDTPEHIKQASYQAMYNGQVHYTSNYGIQPLRQAISHKLENDNHISCNPENEIIVTAGVSEAIMMTMMALLNPGDEVLLIDPQFVCYPMAINMAGAIPVSVPVSAENDYKPQISDLYAKLSPATKMLVLISPGNPTGMVLDQECLEAIAEFSIRNNLLVVADEIYEKLIYDGHQHVSIASLPGMRRRTISLNGFSKSYAMTGWRLGYVAADKHLINALVRIHQYTVVCSTSFAQWGAIAALEGPQLPLKNMLIELDRRRQMIKQALQEMGGFSYPIPQGAMYFYLDVAALSDDAFKLADELLYQAHIAVVPWDKSHIRISYGNSYENLQIAMHRMANFLLNKPLVNEAYFSTV